MKPPRAAIFLLAFTAATAARADVVFMRDGTQRQGIVESHDDGKVVLQVDRDGISGAIMIPMSEVTQVVIYPHSAGQAATPQKNTSAGAAAPSGPPATAHSDAATAAHPPQDPGPITISDEEIAAFRSRSFFGEMLQSLAGNGADEISRMPAAARDLWKNAVDADKKANPADTLDALRALEFTMRQLPGGTVRLDAISIKARDEPFGLWMARVHWQVISSRYSTGQFDLTDVRDIERPHLIGLLKEMTDKALQPLQSYFPPIDEKTGQKEPFRPTQLSGITAANALDIKDKATFAQAVLLAQLKLEPEMSAIDRGFLSGQLADVNHVLSRARDLESAAKMAAARAAQDKKAADEKARHDAAIAKAQAATRPH